jgi:molybdenum cofactor cytidylyltransferase
VIFAAFPLDAALGAILAHSHRLPGRVLKKGAVLDAAAIAALREAGHSEVLAARLEADDIAENEAAERLAAALEAPNLTRGRAGTGRVNLHAGVAGLLRVDAAGVDRINMGYEGLTLGTLPDASAVAPRDMVATVKVIPFAVPGAVLADVERIARAAPVLTIHPFRRLRVGLVVTELPGLKEQITEATIAATEARVAALTGTLLAPLRCAHETAAIAAALRQLLGAGAQLLLVAGASATVDRRDVGPAGVVGAGGEIIHFGMPVDPGNLLCLGRIGAVPAFVLPGCARSPKANGIDLVLQRVFAGLPVGSREIMRMGVGGLLKDTDARPLPRARAAGKPAEPRRAPVAALVLAAGQSTRMAPYNKLLIADRTGKPMIARAVDNVLSSQARPVLVVTGHRGADIRAARAGRPVTFVDAPDYAAGLSASLKAGIAALPAEVAAVLVCLGDMPLVTGRVLDRILAAYDPDEGRAIVLPTHQGRAGNPVLWDRAFFAEILSLTGDAGARSLLKRHQEQVAEVEAGDNSVLRDFDTVDSLATLPTRLRPDGAVG